MMGYKRGSPTRGYLANRMQIGLGEGTVLAGAPSLPDVGSNGRTLMAWEP